MSSDHFPSIEAEHGTEPRFVLVYALSAGRFSLPEEQFVKPATSGARKTVPSLCFLIQHTSPSDVTTRILFDLGLRRHIGRYSDPIRRHVATRQPLTTDPDVVKSLKAGGLTPQDVEIVIYSHVRETVHWDHVGEPRDFPSSTFVVGYRSLDVLDGKGSSLRGGHSFFEADLLDLSRTIQLAAPTEGTAGNPATSTVSLKRSSSPSVDFFQSWKPFGCLPSTLDIFGDGSLYIVDAPGHLPGHLNLLARVGCDKWVYLAGDACHDRRIMRGERAIGEWRDDNGYLCCIHEDRVKAEETVKRIRGLEEKGVEVIFAHDVEWESDLRNQDRFFGNR
ncbi:N-acyl homoserine lactonase AttM [Parachaetomium inaequale]|uniref:N-acyl homoserine lactonase AttM n=1 Tax=Parachaetomium inaequale TaxID=2588326 RepID=A0AAN6PDF0_9PEZI|nr:N-acyl homoserine lactonase AttM [Parachaetomium inaequale]